MLKSLGLVFLLVFAGVFADAAYSPGTYLTTEAGAPYDARTRSWTLGIGDSVTVNTISGFATETSLLGVNTNLTAILAKMPTLVSGNVPVAIQGSVGVTGTFWQATQPVSGSLSVSNFPSSFSVSNFPGTQAVSGTFWQTTQPVSAASLPLPTGASTSANQSTANASLSSIDGKLTSTSGSLNVNITGGAGGGGGGSTTNAPDVTAAGTLGALNDSVIVATQGEGTTIVELTGTFTGSFIFEASNNDFTTSQAVAGVFLGGIATQSATFSAAGHYSVLTSGYKKLRVRASAYTSGSLAVTMNASVGTRISVALQGNPNNLQTLATQGPGGASAWKVDGSAVTQPVSGTVAVSNLPASQVTTDATVDTYITGAGPSTTVVDQNILLATAGTGALDLQGARSISFQVVTNASVTGGVSVNFEKSNNGVNWSSAQMYDANSPLSAPLTTFSTVASQSRYFDGPTNFRYFRVRTITAVAAGTIQAFTQLRPTTYVPTSYSLASGSQSIGSVAVSGSLTSAGTVSTVTSVTTVGSITSSQSAIPGIIQDVASAALTTTTTTATLTPTFGATYKVSIPVTVVSGTAPTLDVQIQESSDGGTNWYAVYDFPRITATGFYHSPTIPLTGNRVRYLQTVTGTTPSFTRSIQRLQSSWVSADRIRQQFDRTIVLTTLNSVTPSLFVGGTGNVDLVVNIGAATGAPVLQLEGSEDNVNWYAVGSPLTAVASSTVKVTVANQSAFLRARVSTAGTGVTPGYVLVKAF